MSEKVVTCGHDNAYIPLVFRNTGFDYDTNCVVKIVEYMVCCKECANGAMEDGDVLNTQAEEDDWLTMPIC